MGERGFEILELTSLFDFQAARRREI